VITNPKKEKEHIRLTVGVDRLDHSGDVVTSTVDITNSKHLSTALSPKMMMDRKKLLLGHYFTTL
jgi:hypothetical protein